MKPMTCEQQDTLRTNVLGICDDVIFRGVAVLKKETGCGTAYILESPALAAYVAGFFAMIIHTTTEDKS